MNTRSRIGWLVGFTATVVFWLLVLSVVLYGCSGGAS